MARQEPKVNAPQKQPSSAPAAAGARNELRMEGGRTPSHEEIARRAFELYEARGRQPGHEVEDWLQAERELGLGRR